MDRKISIRPPQPHEAVAAAAIFSAARKQFAFLPQLHSPDEERDFITACFQTEQVLVAASGGTVCGFAAWQGQWLNHLYVHPDKQGQGCGDLLVARCKAVSSGIIQLWCFVSNTRARQFYERRGFVIAEVTDGLHNEERLPDIRYVWRALPGKSIATSTIPDRA